MPWRAGNGGKAPGFRYKNNAWSMAKFDEWAADPRSFVQTTDEGGPISCGPEQVAGLLIMIYGGIFVIDFDSPELCERFKERFPQDFADPTRVQAKTAKGFHFYFSSDLDFIVNKNRIREGDEVLEMDIKAPWANGTPGAIQIPPANGKEWIVPIYDPAGHMRPPSPEYEEWLRTVAYTMPVAAPAQGAGIFGHKVHIDTAASQDVVELLGMVVDSRLDDYSEWISLGMVCKCVIGDAGLDPWREASRRSPKYRDGVCEQKWETFPWHGKGTGLLRSWAKRDSPGAYDAWCRGRTEHIIDKCARDPCMGENHVAVAFSDMCKDIIAWDGKTFYVFNNGEVARSGADLADVGMWWVNAEDKVLLLLTEVFKVKVMERIVQLSNLAVQAADDEDRREELEALCKKLERLLNNIDKVAFQHNVVSAARKYLKVQGFELLLDADPHLLSFNNGVVWDFEAGMSRPKAPSDYLTKSVGYDLPNTPPTAEQRAVLDRFFVEVFPNPEQRQYVLWMLRSMLDGRNAQRLHNVYLHTGVSGANGKSVLQSIMKRLLGAYCMSISIAMLTQKRGHHTGTDEIMLMAFGKRLIMFEEPDASEKVNSGVIKEYSACAEQTVRGLWKSPVERRPCWVISIACNDNLRLDGSDPALERRVKVIHHQSRFVLPPTQPAPEANVYAADDAFLEQLKKPENIRALMWVMLYEVPADMVVPACVLAATREYMGRYDPVASFVEERLEERPNAVCGVTLSELRKEFSAWHLMAFAKPSTMQLTDLKRHLIRRLRVQVTPQKKINGRNKCNVFLGWDFRPQDDDVVMDEEGGEDS